MNLSIRELNELIYSLGITAHHGMFCQKDLNKSLLDKLYDELSRKILAEVIEEVDANFLAEQYDIERDILKDSNSHIVSNEEADEDFLSTLEQDEQRYEDAGYKPKGVTQSILDYVEFKGEASYTEMQNFYRITFGSNSFSHILISLVVPYKNRLTRRYLYKTASGKYVVRVAGLHNWVEKDY